MDYTKIEIPETHGREDRRLGRHVEHDPRSLGFAHPVLPHSVIKSVEWQARIGVLDQGRLGSCTANASTGWAGTDNIWRQGLTEVEGALLDEAFAVKFYEWETAHDGIPGAYPPDDTGSSGLAAGKTLEHYGLCTQYLHAFSLHAIESALQSGPVLLGLPWHSDMMDADADGNLEITGEIVGGHELCAVGLDVEAKKVKIRNSWGDGWGAEGFFYLTYDQLAELMDERGDVVVPVIGRPLTAA